METFVVNTFCSLVGFFTYILSGYILASGKKKISRTDVLIMIGCFLLYMLPEFFLNMYIINIAKSFIVYFLVLKLVFRVDVGSSLFVCLIFILITNIADIITTAILTSAFKTIYSYGYNDTQIMNAGMMINTVLVVGFAVLFSVLIKDKPYNISFGCKVFMIVCSLISCIIMIVFDIFLTLIQTDNTYLMVVLTIIMLYFNVVIFRFFESFFYETELEAIKKQEQIKAENYALLSESQENMQILRHDMKNHLRVIRSYLENNEIEEAKKYTDKISSVVEENSYIYTENQVMDTLLNLKGKIAKKQGIQYIVKANMSESINIDPMDLCIILGNTLDNAIEGAQKTEKKYIIVYVECTNGKLMLDINNSSPPREEENGVFDTTKSDRKNHGLGIKSIKKAAMKYDGTVLTQYKNGRFDVKISMLNGVKKKR